MRRRPRYGACGGGVILLLLAGLACGGKAPRTHYYTLLLPDVAADGATDAASDDGIPVGVRAFRVDPPYDQDRIVYRVGADSPEVGFYAYHRWAAPLARVLPGLVAERFHGARGIAAIEPTVAGRTYSAFVDGRLTALEEVDVPGGQRIRLAMTLAVREADGTVRWRDSLTAESATDTREVRAIVEAMGAALADALDRGRDSWERSLQ